MPFLVPLIILAIASSACANDEDEELLKGIVEALSAIERFHLWADCGPMSLQVEGLDENAAKIGLSKEATETAMRSRLRAADLYTDKFWISLSGGTRVVRPSLYLEVTVVGPAFSVSLQYRKFLRDVYHSGLQASARTWIQSATSPARWNSVHPASLQATAVVAPPWRTVRPWAFLAFRGDAREWPCRASPSSALA